MKAAADSLNNYDECMAIKNNSELREVIFVIHTKASVCGEYVQGASPDAQRQGETLKNDTVGSGQGITNGSSLQLPCGARD